MLSTQIEQNERSVVKPILAVDVGGVLASKQHDGDPVPDAREAPAILQEFYEIWIVSQCGFLREQRTIEWLRLHEFLIPPERQIYVRFDEDNKNRVLDQIKATHFIDDRPKHLLPALGVESIRRVFHLAEKPLYQPWPDNYFHVQTWQELFERLVEDLSNDSLGHCDGER